MTLLSVSLPARESAPITLLESFTESAPGWEEITVSEGLFQKREEEDRLFWPDTSPTDSEDEESRACSSGEAEESSPQATSPKASAHKNAQRKPASLFSLRVPIKTPHERTNVESHTHPKDIIIFLHAQKYAANRAFQMRMMRKLSFPRAFSRFRGTGYASRRLGRARAAGVCPSHASGRTPRSPSGARGSRGGRNS